MPLTAVLQSEIIASAVFSIISFLANFALIAVFIKHRSEAKQSATSVLSLNLIVGGLLFGLVSAVIAIEKLVKGDINHTGDFGCQVEGAFLMIGAAATVMGNVAVAVERYLLIFRHHKMTFPEVLQLSTFCWLWNILLAILPLVLPDGPYATQSSETYCFVEWWGSKPSVLATAYLTALMCEGGLVFVVYVYARIALLVYRQSKTMESVTERSSVRSKTAEQSTSGQGRVLASANLNPTESNRPLHKNAPPSGKPSRISKKDRQIYFKVVIIAMGYFAFITPSALVVVVGIFARIRMPPAYDFVGGFLAILNPIATAFIIGLLDPVYKMYLVEEMQRIPFLRRALAEPASAV